MEAEPHVKKIHGSGGTATQELIEEIFSRELDNEYLAEMEDAAAVPGNGRLALTTDSFVVTPLLFPGGDIGRLSVAGTVNDLLCRGSVPKYLTAGFILEEGVPFSVLKTVVSSMAACAREAGVLVVAGDTKVVEGKGGMYINTAGVGFLPEGREIGAKRLRAGDVFLISGSLGDHHAAILSQRLSVENEIKSDAAPLTEMVSRLFDEGIDVRCMRDITRGGLSTILSELAAASKRTILLREADLPVSEAVRSFAGLLGLDPLTMGNEGKAVFFVPEEQGEKALAVIRSSAYGKDAVLAGSVGEEDEGRAYLLTGIGGMRRLSPLQGEGLPRIC